MYPAGREVCCAVMTRFIPSCAQGVWQAGELLRELIWWWSTLVAGYLMCLGCHQHTLVTNYFVWDALFDHQNWMQVSHYTVLLWILTSWRGTLPMEAWEYQAGGCFRGGLVA